LLNISQNSDKTLIILENSGIWLFLPSLLPFSNFETWESWNDETLWSCLVMYFKQ